MPRKVGYILKDERQLDGVLNASRLASSQNLSGNKFNYSRGFATSFAKIISLVADTDNKEAKATEVIYNSTTRAFEEPTNPYYYDSDNVTNDRTTTNIVSNSAMAVNDIVEVRAYNEKSETNQWYGIKGGGSELVYVEITASTDANTYTADIYDNPTDRTLIEEDITVKAMQHDNGIIPNSGSGKGLFCTSINGVYYLSNYSVFY